MRLLSATAWGDGDYDPVRSAPDRFLRQKLSRRDYIKYFSLLGEAIFEASLANVAPADPLSSSHAGV